MIAQFVSGRREPRVVCVTGTENGINFDARFKVKGDWARGFAFVLLGYEAVRDEDGEYSGGYDVGTIIGVMVGDDKRHRLTKDDLTEISEDAYCHSCGQLGCTHDGRSA